MPEEAKRRKNPESFAKKRDAGGKGNVPFFFTTFVSRELFYGGGFELTSESMKTIETGPRNLATHKYMRNM